MPIDQEWRDNFEREFAKWQRTADIPVPFTSCTGKMIMLRPAQVAKLMKMDKLIEELDAKLG